MKIKIQTLSILGVCLFIMSPGRTAETEEITYFDKIEPLSKPFTRLDQLILSFEKEIEATAGDDGPLTKKSDRFKTVFGLKNRWNLVSTEFDYSVDMPIILLTYKVQEVISMVDPWEKTCEMYLELLGFYLGLEYTGSLDNRVKRDTAEALKSFYDHRRRLFLRKHLGRSVIEDYGNVSAYQPIFDSIYIRLVFEPVKMKEYKKKSNMQETHSCLRSVVDGTISYK